MQHGILDLSQEQKKGIGEENLSFTVWRSLAGLKNYTDVRLLTKEKHVSFIEFLEVLGGLHKKEKIWTSDQSNKSI